jgi:hypothetical protein
MVTFEPRRNKVGETSFHRHGILPAATFGEQNLCVVTGKVN